MDVGSALVAGGKAAELADPCKRPLDYPPVPPKPGTALDVSSSDARLNVAAGQSTTTAPAGYAAAMVASLVGM